MEISLHSFPIFDNRSEFSLREPAPAFGPDVVAFSMTRSSSADKIFLAHSPLRQPGTLATVVENGKDNAENEDEDGDRMSISTLDSVVRSITPSSDHFNFEPQSLPTFSEGSSRPHGLTHDEEAAVPLLSSALTSQGNSLSTRDANWGTKTKTAGIAFGHVPTTGTGITPLGDETNTAYSTGSVGPPSGRRKVSQDRLNNPSLSLSSSSNMRNVSILSSILATHDLSGRYLGDEGGINGADLMDLTLNTQTVGLPSPSGDPGLLPLPSPYSGGVAYNANVARQFHSDSLTQQRLGQLIQMAEEENDASAELLRRSLYSQSMRSSIASFVACKKVSYVAILFSDIKEGKQ
jgi:hypothetical protein